MRDFLDFLMPPDGYVEIRAIKGSKVRQWWEADRQAAVDLALNQSDEGWDAYYGVLPRVTRHGDSDHIVRWTSVLWADLDAKVHGTKQAALMSLVRYRVPPAVVVDSGHGYHAYWRLLQPEGFGLAQQAMRGIAHKLKGDHVYDQARILRIPGTTNWKDPDAPVPVRTVVFDTTSIHRIGDFNFEIERAVSQDARPPLRRMFATRSPDERLPDWLTELIRDGAPQGQRSEQCFKVMVKLAERGWTDEQIRTAFEAGGIGEKMREQRDGDRWFDYSMKKARAEAR